MRLDTKNGFLVKGRCFEGYQKRGTVEAFLEVLNQTSPKEIILLGIIESLFGTNGTLGLVPTVVSKLNWPLCVGGGIRTNDDVDFAFRSGADRILVNSTLFDDQSVVKYALGKYGTQAVVAHIQISKQSDKFLLARWAGKKIEVATLDHHLGVIGDLGISEVHISSVLDDGCGKGWNCLPILRKVKQFGFEATISGGLRSYDWVDQDICPDGIALASALYPSVEKARFA